MDSKCVNKFASSIGFSKRTSQKIKPIDLIAAYCKKTVCDGSGTLSSIASSIAISTQCTLSKQAVHQRTTPAFVDLLKKCLSHYLRREMPCISNEHITNNFTRVFIEDSTVLKLPDNLAKDFPGASNQSKRTSAQIKIQASFDLKNSSYQSFQLQSYLKNDAQFSTHCLTYLKPNDLIVRDLGYFLLDAFKKIDTIGAFYISRLRTQVKISDECLPPVDLLRYLKKHKDIVDKVVYIGMNKDLKVRIVARRLPEDIADKRRIDLKKKIKRSRGCSPSENLLKLQSWEIYITNIDSDVLSLQQIADIYKLRWKIETIFKCWKSNFKFNAYPNRASKSQILAMIYGRLIFSMFANFVLLKCEAADKDIHISIQKATKFIVETFRQTLNDRIELLTMQNVITYYGRYEKRKRKTFRQLYERNKVVL